MRALALAALCFSSSLVNAIPVTYLFYGQTTSLSVTHGGQQYNDPNTALALEGIEVFNGNASMVGSITIDSELMDYTSPGSAAQNRFNGQVLNWQISTEGQTYYSDYAPGAPQYVRYMDDQIVTFDEVPNTASLLFPDIADIAFEFDQGYLSTGVPSELPVQAFIGGSFHLGPMTSFGSHFDERVFASMFGTITHLYRVSDVPEPATASLLLIGLAGVLGTRVRRRQPQRA